MEVAKNLYGKLQDMLGVQKNDMQILDNENEKKRLAIAQKIYDFYCGDIHSIEIHLAKALGRTFKEDDIREFQFLYIPVLRRIIDKLCLVYKSQTERSLESEGENTKLTELFSISDIQTKSRHWHKMAKLFHTILVQPVLREEYGEKKLYFEIWNPNVITVEPRENNYLLPKKVMYQISNGKEVNTVVWTDEEHYVLNSKGVIIYDENNTERINPYGEIPFAVLRLKEANDFWGEGETILANIEEKIDILLIQLMDLLIMQSHGQPVLKNAKIQGDIQTGARHPLQLLPANPDQPADFSFVSPNGKAKELQDSIDWLISKTMSLYGLAQSSTIESSQASSGYAKMIDNWDVIEQREEDIEILKDFEKRLFQKVKLVCNYDGFITFADNSELKILFNNYTFPQDPVEEIKLKQEKLKVGLWNPIDDLKAMDKTLTDETALEKLRESLSVRNEINDEFGLSITSTNNTLQLNG